MFRYVVAGYDDFRNGGAFETENKFNIMQIVNQYFVKKISYNRIVTVRLSSFIIE